MSHWVKIDHPSVPYAQKTLESGGRQRACKKGMGKVYRIVVRYELSERYAAAFEGMQLERRGGNTVLTGEIIDQPHLHGILDRLNGLGLELLSVEILQEGAQHSSHVLPNDLR